MNHANFSMLFAHAALIGFAFSPDSSAQTTYKCKAADGRIEYSDRPCDGNKATLRGPPSATKSGGVKAADALAAMQVIFDDFEPALCERERLAGDIDRATRSGEITAKVAVWKPKQERLLALNDQMVVFQDKLSKYTKPGGSESEEMAALRKFQSGLKGCDPLARKNAPIAKPGAGK